MIVNQKQLIMTNLKLLLTDLSNCRYYDFVYCFKIEKDLKWSWLQSDRLFQVLFNCFISPSLPTSCITDTEVPGTFFLGLESGLSHLLCLDTKSCIYFIVFTHNKMNLSNFSICNNTLNFETDILLHDRLFSFYLFCQMNEITIQSLDFKFLLSNFGSFFSETINCCYFYTFFKLNNFEILTQKNLCFFALFKPCYSFQFYIVTAYNFTCKINNLTWIFAPLNRFFFSYKSSSSFFESFSSRNSLSVKSSDLFNIYCEASQTVVATLPLQDKAISAFNFCSWRSLAIKNKLFSACGYMPLSAHSYSNEIYNFMQYRLLNSGIHCVYSHLKNGSLFFWCLFDNSCFFENFKKKNKDLFFFVFECVDSDLNFKNTDLFVQKHMYFYPIDYSRDKFCRFFYDFRLASHYIGVYSSDFKINQDLTCCVFDDRSSFYSTDDILYSLSFLLFDLPDSTSSLISTLNNETGFFFDETIWFFCSSNIPPDTFFIKKIYT